MGKVGLKKQWTHNITSGPNEILNITILGISVSVWHMKNYTISDKEVLGCGIIELTTIVTLDRFGSARKPHDNKAKNCGMVENVLDFKRWENIHQNESNHQE